MKHADGALQLAVTRRKHAALGGSRFRANMRDVQCHAGEAAQATTHKRIYERECRTSLAARLDVTGRPSIPRLRRFDSWSPCRPGRNRQHNVFLPLYQSVLTRTQPRSVKNCAPLQNHRRLGAGIQTAPHHIDDLYAKQARLLRTKKQQPLREAAAVVRVGANA